jgi:hypothetical protein
MIDSILPMASKQKHGTNDKLVDTLFLLDVSLIIWAFISDLFGWNASHIYLRPKKLSNPVKSGLRVSHSIIPNSSLSTPCSPPSPGPPFLCHSHVSRFGLRCGHHSTSRCRPTLRVPARPLLCLPPNGALTPNAGDPHAAVPHIAHGWKSCARCRWCVRSPQPWPRLVPDHSVLSLSDAGFYCSGRDGFWGGHAGLAATATRLAALSSGLDTTAGSGNFFCHGYASRRSKLRACS